MGEYSWFCKTIREAVDLNAQSARVLRAVLEGRKSRLPEDALRRDQLEEVIENALILNETREGRREIRRMISEFRYNAGYRTDDIALRLAYRQWQDDSREKVDLLRVNDDDRQRA